MDSEHGEELSELWPGYVPAGTSGNVDAGATAEDVDERASTAISEAFAIRRVSMDPGYLRRAPERSLPLQYVGRGDTPLTRSLGREAAELQAWEEAAERVARLRMQQEELLAEIDKCTRRTIMHNKVMTWMDTDLSPQTAVVQFRALLHHFRFRAYVEALGFDPKKLGKAMIGFVNQFEDIVTPEMEQAIEAKFGKQVLAFLKVKKQNPILAEARETAHELPDGANMDWEEAFYLMELIDYSNTLVVRNGCRATYLVLFTNGSKWEEELEAAEVALSG